MYSTSVLYVNISLLVYLLLCYGLYFTDELAYCIDNSNNLQDNGVPFINPNQTVIVPRLNFSCNGWIMNIKVRINLRDDGNDYPFIQIWRPSPHSQLYSLVDKVQMQSSHYNTEKIYIYADINDINMHFLTGDVIGFYNPPNSGYQLRRQKGAGYFVYHVFDGSEVSQINFPSDTHFDGRLPVIQFTIGE